MCNTAGLQVTVLPRGYKYRQVATVTAVQTDHDAVQSPHRPPQPQPGVLHTGRHRGLQQVSTSIANFTSKYVFLEFKESRRFSTFPPPPRPPPWRRARCVTFPPRPPPWPAPGGGGEPWWWTLTRRSTLTRETSLSPWRTGDDILHKRRLKMFEFSS